MTLLLSSPVLMVIALSDAPLDPIYITSLDVLLNDLKVGVIVRTPGRLQRVQL